MKINIPKNVTKIIAMLEEHGYDAYAVGGCVRDSLLHRVPGDWDITTSARPEEIKSVFRKTIDTGIEHGTVTVRMGGENYEVTTYRIDGDYSDRRHPDSVIFTGNLTEDLKRRDFTINAMAYNEKRGVVDEYGGIRDLEEGLIRCVGVPDERFDEDALRILRAVRFSAQLGFEIEPGTLAAASRHAAELKAVSAERIFTELNKTLTGKYPCRIRLIFTCGMADHICPSFHMLTERDAAELVPPEAFPDRSLDEQGDAPALPADKYMRWSALMKRLDGAEAVKILTELKSDNETMRRVRVLVDAYKKPLPENEVDIRCCLRDIGPELLEDLILLKAYYGEPALKVQAVSKALRHIMDTGECWNLKMLALTGNDLIRLGFKPGKQFGEILETLLDHVIRNPEDNRKEVLEELADEYRKHKICSAGFCEVAGSTGDGV